jgi:cell division protein FtsI (penicillin-binding protein 3)
MLVALEDHKVKLTDSVITGEGYTTYHRRAMKDAHKIGNGRITVRDAFEHSSNVGISKIITNAYQDDPTDFIDGIYKLHVNTPLGIELQGEGKPYIKHPSNKKTWYGTSLPWMSIGYELTLTPLQNLTLYNAVANGGKMVKPMFVTEVREAGITKEKFETQVIDEQIVSQETIKQAQSLLRGVVERGTARRAFKGAPYPVAGKTGTTQIVSGGSYQRHQHNALFVGYFPADNPKYSCIVVVNNPRGRSYYGGTVAAPVFRKISDEIYATSLALEQENLTDTASVKYIPVSAPAWHNDIKNIYEELSFPVNDYTHNDPWVTSAIADNKLEINAEYFTPDVTPDVKGMKAKDAVYLLENLGYKTTIKGKGKVRWQSVKAGTPVTKGREIKLQLASY